MNDTPYKTLTDRVEAHSKTFPIHSIFGQAGLPGSTFYNWRKGESPMMLRWFNLLRNFNLDPWSIKPETKTFELIKSKVISRDLTIAEFQKVGYSDQTAEYWEANGDPRHIEAFKRVNLLIRNHENSVLA